MRDGDEHLGQQAGLQEEAVSRQRAAAAAEETGRHQPSWPPGPDTVTLEARREGLLLALAATESETSTPTRFLWL